MTPYLSAAQREIWRRIPRLQGRLWGVTIDHGGEPGHGAGARSRRGDEPDGSRPGAGAGLAPDRIVIGRPGAAGRRSAPLGCRAEQLESGRQLRPQVLVVRQPAVVVRPAPPQDGDDEPEARAGGRRSARQQQLQIQRMKQLQQAYLSLFDRRVFGGRGEMPLVSRSRPRLAHRVDYLRLRRRAHRWPVEEAPRGRPRRYQAVLRSVRRGEGEVAGIRDQRALALMIAEAATLSRRGMARAAWRSRARSSPGRSDRTLTEDQRAAIAKEDRRPPRVPPPRRRPMDGRPARPQPRPDG